MPDDPLDPHPRTGPTRPSRAGDARNRRDHGLATSRRLTRGLVAGTAALVLGLSALAGGAARGPGGPHGPVSTRVAARTSPEAGSGTADGGSSSVAPAPSAAPAPSSAAPAVTSGAS